MDRLFVAHKELLFIVPLVLILAVAFYLLISFSAGLSAQGVPGNVEAQYNQLLGQLRTFAAAQGVGGVRAGLQKCVKENTVLYVVGAAVIEIKKRNFLL
jgi:hypothetical protein